MKRNIGFILLFICSALLTYSTGFIAFNIWDENRAYRAAMRTSLALYEQILLTEVSPAEVTELSAGNTPGFIEVDGELYIGILSIPSLSLELPINNEQSDEKLKESPCRYYGDLFSSLVVSAHSYKRHFGLISNLKYGDLVTITDANGDVHEYSVELVAELSETDIDGMINSPYDLTLFTCTPSHRKRVTVRCSKLNAEEDEVPAVEEPVPEAVINDAPDAPDAPKFIINYSTETVKVRKGYLYSLDGIEFTEVTDADGVAVDVSDCITNGTPVYLRRCAIGERPVSKTQIITPVSRSAPESQMLSPVGGKLTLDGRLEVFNPVTKKWGKLPRITTNAAFYVRLKSTVKNVGGQVTGNAASLPALLVVKYGEYDVGKEGVITAEIVLLQ